MDKHDPLEKGVNIYDTRLLPHLPTQKPTTGRG